MEGKRRLLGSLFPTRYDFYRMLQDQADQTVKGVGALIIWLDRADLSEPAELIAEEQKADDMRHIMEDRLMEAFTTPFDRQDLYSISRQMDYILNYCMSTAIEMRAFEVPPDTAIRHMALALGEGVREMAEAIHIMEEDHLRAEAMIVDMRRWEKKIEHIYVDAMRTAFQSNDALLVMKDREIYHHLKDAGRTLSITIDILHRIAVGIA